MIEDKEILESQKHLLLQEIYCDDPWKMLICCIFLNQTNRKQVDGIRLEFFRRYPDMFEVKRADSIEMSDLLKPLGFKNKRTHIIKRFSSEWMSSDWEEPSELYGIGEYGQDSWEIFQKNNTSIDPKDGVLKKYLGNLSDSPV
jgi:methyl-CpG-binding domain protein 4